LLSFSNGANWPKYSLRALAIYHQVVSQCYHKPHLGNNSASPQLKRKLDRAQLTLLIGDVDLTVDNYCIRPVGPLGSVDIEQPWIAVAFVGIRSFAYQRSV
jgi:hypothetical protein